MALRVLVTLSNYLILYLISDLVSVSLMQAGLYFVDLSTPRA